MYVDSYGLIVQQDGDAGDTLQREGMYAFGMWLRYNDRTNTVLVSEIPARREPARIMDKMEIRPGIYVRHPDPSKWWSDPNTTSRDQLVPVIAYCAAYQDHSRLWRLFKAVASRGFFAQNTLRIGEGVKRWKIPDTMIAHLGLFIRAGGWYTAPLYPLLFVTDAVDLIGTVLGLVPLEWQQTEKNLRWSEPRDVDDNNSVIAHLMAVKFKPTPVSWLNRMIYASARPYNYGNTRMGEINPVMGALVWYHRPEARANPEMAELYRPLVEEYFSPREDYLRFVYNLSALFGRARGVRVSSL